MPTVKQLIDNLNQDKKSVVTTEADESIAVALNKMLKHDFTQLPFKEEDKYFFVTTTSILCALSSFGGTISESKLVASHAKVPLISPHTEDDDIFDVMTDIEKIGAALIVDDKGIRNILTTYDTTLFFQQWSEDTMHVREIERGLKDIINLTFKNQDGQVVIEDRNSAVELVSSSFSFSKDKLLKGLKTIHHVGLIPKTKLDLVVFNECFSKLLTLPPDKGGAADSGEGIRIDESTVEDIKISIETYCQKLLKDELPAGDVLKKAFPDIFGDKAEASEFDNLVLGQYIQILLGPSWEKCQPAFKLDKERVSFILEGVRITRNKLAHFHDEEVTTQDRLQLTQCNDLLRRTKREMSR